MPIGEGEVGSGQSGDDIVLAFRTQESRAQGRIVRLGAAVDTILAGHAYPDAVSEVLGRAVALVAMLGSLLNANGRLILQTKTDGPLRQIVVSLTAPGDMRALASFDAARVAQSAAAGEAALVGSGHLAMTIDPGGEEPRTQGIVAVTAQTLADAAHDYFRQSEQVPTFIRLAVARHSVRGGGWHWRAGGLILQRLPTDLLAEGVAGHGG